MRTTQKINDEYFVIYTFEESPRIDFSFVEWNSFCRINGAEWQRPMSYAELYEGRDQSTINFNERIESRQLGNAVTHGWAFPAAIAKKLQQEIAEMTLKCFGVDYENN